MAYLIAFSSGWKMTLVVTASIPLMVIAGGIQASVMTGFSSQVFPPFLDMCMNQSDTLLILLQIPATARLFRAELTWTV